MKMLSLKQMIFAGFGLVLAILVVLSLVALRGTNTIGYDFDQYRHASHEGRLINEANTAMLRLRFNVMQYRISRDESYLAGIEQRYADFGQVKDEISTVFTEPARLERLDGFTAMVSDYMAAFSQYVARERTLANLMADLAARGTEARQAISDIVASAYRDGDAEAANYGGLVMQHLMLARYYGEKFLLDNRAEDHERALAEIAQADQQAQTLQRSLQNPARRALLATYDEVWAAYEALYTEAHDLIQVRNTLVVDQLDRLGPMIADGYTSVLDDVLATQDVVGTEAEAAVASTTRFTLIISIVAVLLGIAAAFFIGRTISGSISRVVARMKDLAENRLDIDIPGADRKDELGDMARALLVFQENGREKVRLEAEQEEQARLAEEEKRRTMNELADTFETNVNGVVSMVSSAAEQMVGLANMLSESAARAGERSTAVAAASEEASTNVETVAAASEEMANSIAEVSERVGQSANMTEQAARGAEHTTQTVSKLSTSAQTIGEVISMISAIAEQTNLLALNATIEAARAGEAGKGFAVVASEVKSLANQTAKATEEISAQITGMQGDTDAVVSAIEKIGSMIQELNSTSSSIAAAVEEQHSATQEIARNTQQAADGTREVSTNISGVSTAVQETGQAASEVLTASSQLAQEAERLRDSVADFLRNVRAA